MSANTELPSPTEPTAKEFGRAAAATEGESIGLALAKENCNCIVRHGGTQATVTGTHKDAIDAASAETNAKAQRFVAFLYTRFSEPQK